MKADWTPAGGSAVTLGDDSVKATITLEALGLESAEQVDQLFRAAAVTRRARGNTAGDCVFTVGKSHATAVAALAYLKAELVRVDKKGSLVLTDGTTTVTMANALLRAVTLDQVRGVRVWIRYRFGISTIT